MSAIARLSLISTMIYTLKDGAERKLLSGKTYVHLNLLTGFWTVTGE